MNPSCWTEKDQAAPALAKSPPFCVSCGQERLYGRPTAQMWRFRLPWGSHILPSAEDSAVLSLNRQLVLPTLQHLVRDAGLSLWAYGGVVAGAAFLMVQVRDFSLSQLDAKLEIGVTQRWSSTA
jgi:hypothetical protein